MNVTGCEEVIFDYTNFDCACVCVVCVCRCALTLPYVGHYKTGFSGLVDDMRLRTPAAAIISSSVGDGVHW